jgi:hypothetical protein
MWGSCEAVCIGTLGSVSPSGPICVPLCVAPLP